MRNLIVILSLLAIGCTKNSNNNIPQTAKESFDREINISALTLSSLNVSVESEELDFGLLDNAVRESTRVIKITNSSNQAASFSIDDSALMNGFSVKLNRCSSSLAAKASCNLTLSFKSRALYDGTKNSTLLLASGESSVSLNLSGQITGSPNPQNTGVGIIQLTLENPFEEDGLPYREIQVKNIGTGTAKNIQFELTQEFSIRLNRCPSDLEPGKECRIQVLLKNWRSNPPIPDKVMMVSSESGASNILSEKQVSLSSGSAGDFVPTFTATYGALPPNDKTAVCSGTVTYTQAILSCTDYFGHSVPSSNCAAGDSITYYSPAGISSTDIIPNGSREYRCDLGQTVPYFDHGSCSSPYNYLPTDATGLCHLAPELNVAACENGYEGDNCTVSVTNGVAPLQFQIDNTTGGASISNAGVLNPSASGSTKVTVTDAVGQIAEATLTSIRPLYNSCREILQQVPSSLNQDGFYTIDGDGIRTGESKLRVFCDMTLHGGGWTLLFTGDQKGTNAIGAVPNGLNSEGVTLLSGTHTGIYNVTIKAGTSIENQELQKAVRTVKFTQLKLYNMNTQRTAGYFGMTSSVPNTSFASKFAARGTNTWTGYSTTGINACVSPSWDKSYLGGVTALYAYLGCPVAQPLGNGNFSPANLYNDMVLTGIGVTTYQYNGGVGVYGCGITGEKGGSPSSDVSGGNGICRNYYLLAVAEHRGMLVYGAGSYINYQYHAWVR